jgi:hypothetical protein
MNFYLYAANTCWGISLAALLMAEYGASSLFGNWHPTHEAAIAYGVLSIALSNLGKNKE